MIYKKKYTNQIAFPIGGIGTGTISISGKGELTDWEIFNHPGKGNILPYTFFVLRIKQDDLSPPIIKVLQSTPPIYQRNTEFGIRRDTGLGLPHIEICEFKGEYPFALINFIDKSIPVKVTMEAYNPFIPMNDLDSGIPIAIFNFYISNKTNKKVKISLGANLYNAVGCGGYISTEYGSFYKCSYLGKNVNKFVRNNDIAGIFMYSLKHAKNSPLFGSMAITTTWKNINYTTHWLKGTFYDSLQSFWNKFSVTGSVKKKEYGPSDDGESYVCSIVLNAEIEPGKTVKLPIFISWYFPNFIKYWHREKNKPVWKNYYAKFYKDAFDVAKYVVKNIDRLYKETKIFHDTLFNSSLPDYVLDAISSQMSIIKSTSCIRLSDGTFYSFEGCSNESGCCEGSCAHVYNYVQTLAFLFPNLQRTMHIANYKYNMFSNGKMCFRLQLPLGSKKWNFYSACDGQLGDIMEIYREWKLSGNENFLKKLWNKIKKSLGYIWKEWDINKDGVIEGIQHNTYDIEFISPNTMIGSWYLGSLKASEKIALYLGDNKIAEKCRQIFEKGKKWMDDNLFNGEYYVQYKINRNLLKSKFRDKMKYTDWLKDFIKNKGNKHKYQFLTGCLSDQLIGQWFSHIVGLGYLFDRKKIKKALESIYKYNFRTNFKTHVNCQRIYAIDNEKGLILCSWPKGGKPQFPFPYCDEVWSGTEYQVAAHLIYEGYIKEGLSIIKGLRERYDGYKRNPYNEIECGNHYVRSMASWSLLIALSGFYFDLPNKLIGFDPKINKDNFQTFWSVDSCWGNYYQKKIGHLMKIILEIKYGNLLLEKLILGHYNDDIFNNDGQFIKLNTAKINNKNIYFYIEEYSNSKLIKFEKVISFNSGDKLEITLINE